MPYPETPKGTARLFAMRQKPNAAVRWCRSLRLVQEVKVQPKVAPAEAVFMPTNAVGQASETF